MDRPTLTHTPTGAPIIGIVGWKKSGKTTLTVKLVEEFTRRGLRVATIKHAHHTFRSQVAVVSPERWAIIRELGSAPEPDFQDILDKLDPCDLVIVEGYNSSPIP